MKNDDAASRETARRALASETGEKTSAEDRPLYEQLSRVYHDLNNSLSVISGNAQLLSEMVRAEALGPSFAEPLKDIEAARAEISEVLQRLDRLRTEATNAEK